MTRGAWVASEAVTPGHPDKVADQLADAVVDAVRAGDPAARAGVEVLVSPRRLVVSGRIVTRAPLPWERLVALVEEVAVAAGYGPGPFHVPLPAPTFDLEQIPPAGDGPAGPGQGVAFGFATDETPAHMPREWVWAHDLAGALAAARAHLLFLGPDAKVQVGARIDGGGAGPVNVAVAVQVDPSAAPGRAAAAVEREVVRPCLSALGVEAGSIAVREERDRGLGAGVGLTGRKLGMDAYGGMVPWAGGALSGKDLTRFDRIGALAARAAALVAVRCALAAQCLVTLTAEPDRDALTLGADALGTSFLTPQALTDRLAGALRLDGAALSTLAEAVDHPLAIAAGRGHFGDPRFAWEREGVLGRGVVTP